MHSRSDDEDGNVISIGLFENFNIEKAARYEIRITKREVTILKYLSGTDDAHVELPVTGDLLNTHDDPWVWVEVDRGEICIGSSATPPALNEGRPVGAEPLIRCDDGDSLTVTHMAVRSWTRDKDSMTSDAQGYVPSKNDWIIDVPGEPGSSWFRWDGWAEFNQTTFEARSIYVFLVFMMVSYVFLVSTAVQPWICFQDADGRFYLTADPTVNCKRCEFEDDIPPWLGGYMYAGLKVLSAIALVVYGLAIPGSFFWIVHKHKEEVKSGPYLQKYGFLTSKFSEKYYGWEIAVLFRKASLSVITAHAGKTSTRCGLLSMSVMFVAFGGQMAAQPFCHDDANMAEMLSIASTCIILLIGLGYDSIGQAEDGDIDDKTLLCETHPDSAEDCAILHWMNIAVYAIVFFTVLVSSSIVYARYGGFLYSRSIDQKIFMDKKSIKLIHKSKMEASHVWWSDPKTKEEDKQTIQAVLEEIEKFAEDSGLRHDRAFARFFTDEKRPSLYGYLAGAKPDQRKDLQKLIKEIHAVQLKQAMAGIPCECLRKRVRKRAPKSFTEPPQIPIYKDYDATRMHAGTIRESVAELEDVTTSGLMLETMRESFSLTSRLTNIPGLDRLRRNQTAGSEGDTEATRAKRKRTKVIVAVLVFLAVVLGFVIFVIAEVHHCNTHQQAKASCKTTPATLSTNAKINEPGSNFCTKTTTKSTCAVACKDGYQPVDDTADTAYTCGDAGEWVAKHPLICVKRSCGEVITGLDAHAQASCTGHTFRDTCTAHCNAQYNSSVSGSFECDQDGHWKIEDGTERQSCTHCPHGQYALQGHTGSCTVCNKIAQCTDQKYVSCTGPHVTDHACSDQYGSNRCEEGYTGNLQCDPVDCGPKVGGLDDNSASNCTGRTKYEGKCEVTCHEGFSCHTCAIANETKATFKCAATGEWRGRLNCTANLCSVNDAIPNSQYHGVDSPCRTATGELCDYECKEGFDRLGNHTCYANGTMAGGGCVGRPCTSQTVRFSDRDSDSPCTGITGDECHFTCEDGYVHNADPLVCGADHSFSGGSCVAEGPPSCWHVQQDDSSTVTGRYKISPGGEFSANATCEMTFDGGGWTSMFISEEADNLHYTVDSLALRQGDTGRMVVMGFVDEHGNLLTQSPHSWAMFPMPIDWVRAAPMEYLRRSTQVTGLLSGSGAIGTGPYTFDVVYGFSGFTDSQECSASNWDPTAGYRGQVGLDIHKAEETQSRWTAGHAEMMNYDLCDDRPAYPCGGTVKVDNNPHTECHRVIEAVPGQSITLTITEWHQQDYSTSGWNTFNSGAQVWVWEGDCPTISSCVSTYCAPSTSRLIAHKRYTDLQGYTRGGSFTPTGTNTITSTGNRICVAFNTDWSYSAGFTASITCQGDTPSPWFNNFAIGSPGSTPALQPDRRAMHCNDFSTQRSWDADVCELGESSKPAKHFAIFVREVDCSEKTDAACKELHRQPCFNTTNKCGSCLHGYKGNAGDEDDAGSGCLAICTDAPSCAGLHRSACSSQPNTCGECLSGYSGVTGHSNTVCSPDSTQHRRQLALGGTDKSCSSIKRRLSSAPSGLYPIVSGDEICCEMTIDGGGWTSVFVVNEGDNREYMLDITTLRGSTDMEVLVGSIDPSSSFITDANYMRFLMPQEWFDRAPMAYLHSATQVQAAVSALDGSFPFDLVYGLAGFDSSHSDCSASHWDSSGSSKGQLCLDVQTARAEQLTPALAMCEAETAFNDLSYHPLQPCGGTIQVDNNPHTECHRVIETLPWQSITLTITEWHQQDYSTSGWNTFNSGAQVWVWEGDCPTISSCVSTYCAPSTSRLIAHKRYTDLQGYTRGGSFTPTGTNTITSTGNRICVAFNTDWSYSAGFTASITCQGDTPSPWFNNFAADRPGLSSANTPALQLKHDQVHCNDLSSGSVWNKQPCDVRKRLAIFVREIDCSSAPSCAALHREGCYSTANTCGLCLVGFDAPPGDSNTACTPSDVQPWQPPEAQTPQQPASDCMALNVNQPNAQTGVYKLNAAGHSYETVCNMAVDGGGWTALFLGGADSQHYLVEPELIQSTTALEALVGFIDSNNQLFAGNARFLLPPRWHRRPPTTYVQQHQVLNVRVDSAGEQRATLVYGYSDFDGRCDYMVMPSSDKYKGSICFMGIEGAPWWNDFASGDWDQTLSSSTNSGFCNSGNAASGARPCSDAMRFAIFVRPVACDATPHECGAELNREACFDKPNTCGNCTSGFTGIVGHSNEACHADCSAVTGEDGRGKMCTSLHRHPCDATATGMPQTCGSCIDGYSGEDGYSNTLCTLTELVDAPPMESCYEIHRRFPDTSKTPAMTGQYLVAPRNADGSAGTQTETVYCEMTAGRAGPVGGWTSIFVSDSAKCDGKQPRERPGPPFYTVPNDYYDTCHRDNLRYTADALALRQGDTDYEALIGFIDEQGKIEQASMALFLMPQEWKERAPMSYLRQHNNLIASVGGAAPHNTTLVYGHSDFFTSGPCSFDAMKTINTYDKHDMNKKAGNNIPNLYRGQVCMTDPKAPWFNNFTVGASWGAGHSLGDTVGGEQMAQAHCVSSSTAGFDSTNCSTKKRFAIFARPIDCDSAPRSKCDGLHRYGCFSTPNTCGNCTVGYVAPAFGHSNAQCVADCSAIPDSRCSSLHRQSCQRIASARPQTCGSCLDGYSGVTGYSNTLCAPMGLALAAKATPAAVSSCYQIRKALGASARTGQYRIYPSGGSPDEGAADVVVTCEMDIEDGGWTSVFVSDSGQCSDAHARQPASSPLFQERHDYFTTCARDNLRYTMDDMTIRKGATDREVLMGFVDRNGTMLPGESRARFLQPDEWMAKAPMEHLREHTDVAASVNGASVGIVTLVFGSSYFEKDCDYQYTDSLKGFQEDVPASIGGNQPAGAYHGYRGQVCLMTPDSPWYANFSFGETATSMPYHGMSKAPVSESEPGYCKSGLAGGAPRRGFSGDTAVVHCSAERQFAIFVREIECDDATGCADLNREGCFSSANTCGRCLPGFIGAGPQDAASRRLWDSNEPCTPDPNHVVEDDGRRQLEIGEGQDEDEAEGECADAAEVERLRSEVEDMERLRNEMERLEAVDAENEQLRKMLGAKAE